MLTSNTITNRETLGAFLPVVVGLYAIGVLVYVLSVTITGSPNEWFEAMVALVAVGTFIAAADSARRSVPKSARFVVGLTPLAVAGTWAVIARLLDVTRPMEPHAWIIALYLGIVTLAAGQLVAVVGYETGARIA